MTTRRDRCTLDALNRLDETEFTRALGDVFEHSPWVAAEVWPERPFADVAALHRSMAGRVLSASRSRRLALLRAHPELAGREAQEGALTGSSAREQARAGLLALSRDEIARIARLNADYRARFGFPFVIAVGNYTKRGVLREFERRLANDPETEFDICVEQVCEIGLIRLELMLGN